MAEHGETSETPNWFCAIFPQFCSYLGQKILSFYKFLPKGNTFMLSDDHHESFSSLKVDIARAKELNFSSSKPGLQFVFLYDASFHGTGFVLMIEDYLINQKVK